jgi:hypothetical protein
MKLIKLIKKFMEDVTTNNVDAAELADEKAVAEEVAAEIAEEEGTEVVVPEEITEEVTEEELVEETKPEEKPVDETLAGGENITEATEEVAPVEPAEKVRHW